MTLPAWLSGSRASRIDFSGLAGSHLLSAAAALNPDASTAWSVPAAFSTPSVESPGQAR